MTLANSRRYTPTIVSMLLLAFTLFVAQSHLAARPHQTYGMSTRPKLGLSPRPKLHNNLAFARLQGIANGAVVHGATSHRLSWKSVGLRNLRIDLKLPTIKINGKTLHSRLVPLKSQLHSSGFVNWTVSDTFFHKAKRKGVFGGTALQPVPSPATLRIRGSRSNGKPYSFELPIELRCPKVTITAPKKNSNIYSGLWHHLRWHSTGAKASSVTVYIVSDGIGLPLFEKEVPNNGHYHFQVPKTVKPSGPAHRKYFFVLRANFPDHRWNEQYPVKARLPIRLR